jgi:NAD(P)-dependent dehydrogenase (short-subunit alcohol dehydrogenase family)
MKGKAVILAGGSGGLGSAVAAAVAERGGIPVIGCKSNRDRAQTVAGEILAKYGIEAPIVVGDILEARVRQELLTAAGAAGTLYGMVPLVGHPARTPIETATEQDLIESMRQNFVGPVLLARDFASALGDQDGAIVFVSTMQGVAAFAGSTAYAAPKAALIHTARILAKQWKMRVNVVAPGVNDAGMAGQSVSSGKYVPFLEKRVIPRYGRPSDVSRAIVFFLEPDAYLTGQVLTVDGGMITKM